MQEYYRFEVDGVGIYEAVDRDCPKEDSRRENKPDGSWLAKVGLDYAGAISFWTEKGIKKYYDSGLLNWHVSVVKGNVIVVIAEKPSTILYADQDQIICDPRAVKVREKVLFTDFVEDYFGSGEN